MTEEQHGPPPKLMARALGVAKMRVIETDGDSFEAGREQRDGPPWLARSDSPTGG